MILLAGRTRRDEPFIIGKSIRVRVTITERGASWRKMLVMFWWLVVVGCVIRGYLGISAMEMSTLRSECDSDVIFRNYRPEREP